ncbi:ABC-three component system protein, partial [Hyphomonas sp. NPDC076900]|uniref:ABC-three component system protein n=1 Tax=unclassified Hyphomonas TaxID=2630699 RepID=UPI003D006923
ARLKICSCACVILSNRESLQNHGRNSGGWVKPKTAKSIPAAAQVTAGIPIPPTRIIEIYSPDEWEEFTEEWLYYHKSTGEYQSVRRYSGPGDLGLDVVAFTKPEDFNGEWHSYQCKHYDHPLTPGDIRTEVAKIIFHSFKKSPPFNQAFPLPSRHMFIAPRGCGITVARWLKDPNRFKAEVRDWWLAKGLPNIGASLDVQFDGEFLNYYDAFDFSIFGDKSKLEIMEEHKQTAFHTTRFGGGLPARDQALAPPTSPSAEESAYIKKLFDTYTEQTGVTVNDRTSLLGHATLLHHYDRQRELFYHAESLRNFARDRTPDGTFEGLKGDIFHGVIDVCEATHPNGLDRLRAAITSAGGLDISGSALASVTHIPDKQGICHHLANEDRLTWVLKDER